MLDHSDANKMQQALGKVKVGDYAPDFSLPDQSNTLVTLGELAKDNLLVLYFYPGDFTMGCTMEACSFRDNYQAFTEAGATVVGVSPDSVESHQRFVEQHHLPFTLLSDESGAVQTLYGVRPLFLDFFPGRITYILDRRRIVRHVFSSRVNIPGHTTQALKIIRALQAESQN